MPLGTLYQDDGSLLQISVDELVRNATMHQMDNGKFTVNEFVRNPNVLVEIHRNGNTIDWGSIMGEAITFVLIPRASIPISVALSPSTNQSFTPFSLSMTCRSNWVVWPKATPAGMALAERPKKIHTNVEVHKSHVETLLKNKAVNKAPEKGFLGKAWDWVKDIDWKKWTSVASTLAPLILDEQEVNAIVYPDEYYVNIVANTPTGYSCADPEVNRMLEDYYRSVDAIRTWYQSHNKPYNYPVIKWDPPESFVADNRKETWARL